jgi:hypothetical protein
MTAKKYHFKPEMCDIMIQMGLSGASQKMIWSELGINKDVAKTWCKNHPDFADALELAKTHSQAFWEREILANVNNKAFNSRLAEIALRGQFQDDYRETREQKVEGKVDVVIDFSGAVNDLIKQLKGAKDD